MAKIEILRKMKSSAAWKRAEAYGIDMSLLESNLRHTVAERLRQHDAALQTLLALREAVKKKHATTV